MNSLPRRLIDVATSAGDDRSEFLAQATKEIGIIMSRVADELEEVGNKVDGVDNG